MEAQLKHFLYLSPFFRYAPATVSGSGSVPMWKPGVLFDMISSSVSISSSMSSNNGDVMYLSAVSGSMHRMLLPGAAPAAMSSAILNVDPPLIPVIIPSSAARRLAIVTPSLPDTGSSWSKYWLSIEVCSTCEMKSGVQPWMGCGTHAGWEALGVWSPWFLSCG